MVQKQSKQRDPDAPIDSTGEILRKRTIGDAQISLNIEASADAGYAVDVGFEQDDGSMKWYEGEETYAIAETNDPQDIRDAFIVGDEYVRVRVTDTAAAGETADVTLQEAH